MIAKRQTDALAGVPDDVIALTDELQITAALETAITLVRETIPAIHELNVYKDSDADESGEWVVIEVISTTTVDDVSAAYDSCLGKWITNLPQEALRKVRLTIGFA